MILTQLFIEPIALASLWDGLSMPRVMRGEVCVRDGEDIKNGN